MNKFMCAAMIMALTGCASMPIIKDASPSWADALDARVNDQYASEEHRAFDFWIGEWSANWRSKPEGEFYHEKEGSWTHQRVFPVLGGKALVELAWDRDKPEEASQRGFSIRYYDSARERWVMAQNWPSAANQGSAFTDQLIGDEHLGRLSMYSLTERPNAEGEIVVQHRRYNFADVRPGVSFRWDGSNTPDKGATWFTWNVVDFMREQDLKPYGLAGEAFPGVHGNNLCTAEPHGALNGLQGVWAGAMTNASGAQSPARLSAGLVLDGCGVLSVLEAGGQRVLLAAGYLERFSHWVIFRLDDQPGTTHSYYVSRSAGDGASFEEAEKLVIVDEFSPYLRKASFNTDNAQRRIVFEALGDSMLVLREETRSGAGWRQDARYELRRSK
ncbi:hypothetical protein [Hyphococcus sp.]|uniref:hypothetical protein n=1 Tax=Hyphococcus sp. TaxID=2038636 RepID=UPI00207FF0D2|nr:MAG: hypothetical protein DHS20C04_09560 [Marinicaulis sp.]